MTEFEPYSTSHQIVAAILVVGSGLLAWHGRARRGTAGVEVFCRGFAVAIVVVTVPLQVLTIVRAESDVAASLPLQLCDVASFVAPYALWTRRAWATALAYFWGLTLTSQALITPDLSRDFPDPGFLLFWAMHVLVFWAAVYLVWGLGLVPTWQTYRSSVVITAGWAVAAGAFNASFGTNYGYLSHKPGSSSILDLFGPWPWYNLVQVVILLVGWALITWPWVNAGAIRPRAATRLRGNV